MTVSSLRRSVIGAVAMLVFSSGAAYAQAADSDDTAFIERNEAQPGQYAKRGQAYLSAGKFAQAESEFTRALAQMPPKEEEHMLYWVRGGVRMQLQKNAGAIEDFTSALQIAEAAQIYHTRARAYFALEQFDQANSDLTSALALGLPAGAELEKAYELRAYIHTHQRKYAAAIDDLSSAIEIHPAPPLFFHRANLLRAAGNPQAAYYDYRKVVADEGSPASMATQSFLELAFIYHARRDVLNAMTAYDMFFSRLAGADEQTRAHGVQVIQKLMDAGLYTGAALTYDAKLRNALTACVKDSKCNP